jgi:hypothetical protein
MTEKKIKQMSRTLVSSPIAERVQIIKEFLAFKP